MSRAFSFNYFSCLSLTPVVCFSGRSPVCFTISVITPEKLIEELFGGLQGLTQNVEICNGTLLITHYTTFVVGKVS
jgi:hypothetical protein